MDLQYQLKAGSYYLYDMRDTPSAVTGERRFKLKTDLLAIAFDLSTGELREHGTPSRIQSWATNTRRRLRAAGQWLEAADIIVVSGPFPVEEINKCLNIRGYCRRLFQRLATLPHGKLQTRPAQPKPYGQSTYKPATPFKASPFKSTFKSTFSSAYQSPRNQSAWQT